MGLSFSSKGRHLLGLDVSTTSVKLVELTKQQGRLHLKSYGVEPLEPGWVVDKNIVNGEEVGEAIARLVRRSGAGAKDAATAVSGSAVITKIIDMETNMSDSDREAQIKLDAEQYIPYPLAEVNMDFEVLGPSTTDPNLVRVLLAASRSENVDQRVETLLMGGLTAKVMDIESHAIERAFSLMVDNLPNDPQVVALIDLGHKQSTLYIAKDGEFIYNREQGFGGAQLTEEIQSRYSIPYHDATIGKHEHTLPADYHESVLTPFMENIVQQISRSLQFYFSSSEYNNVDHIVLCGGTSALPGLAQMVQQRVGGMVSVANPFEGMSIDSRIDAVTLQKDAPSLMAACGLALRGFD
ncbi:ethanolamine utilization protein EutJ [Moraxella caprae]|uniref:Ethanolamine utilization protein EutJ n=1 Tax=Moraxella caprae TaxID=90240 RepID=A0A378R419_9GAMM|nr:pilus assembly protein PilM [Moraxella caprae]STZ09539.1 ethanolamine utilization protein EutJ [Moraxella caprae]